MIFFSYLDNNGLFLFIRYITLCQSDSRITKRRNDVLTFDVGKR